MAATPASEISCNEKARLMRQYNVAASDYSRAVQLLQRRAGVMKKADYDELRGFAEKARKTAEEARAALDRHTTEHGC
jgi:hypothetical protein